MKKIKFFLIILFVFLILIGIYFLATYGERKREKLKEEIQEDFEYAVQFCTKNQEDIVEISEEYLTMVYPDMSFDEIINIKSQIENPRWEEISLTLHLDARNNMQGETDKVFFFYDSYSEGIFFIDILYMKADVSEVEEYLSYSSQMLVKLEKICENVYVCLLENRQE